MAQRPASIRIFSEAAERRIRRTAGVITITGCLLLPAAPHAFAQSTTADILGSVTDASGAAIPNATVTLTNLGTREVKTTQSTGAGDYTFTQLGPGTYSVQVTENGFKSFVVPSVSLAAGDRAREDAKLVVGAQAQTVQVTSQTPALQTDTSALSSTITEQAVQNLPLNGRNYINLAQITPGANEGPGNGLNSGARPDDRRQTSSVSINGQSEIINDELIDGLDNNERIIGTIGVRPSIEAIREINVQSNAFTAEVGRTAGGIINIITKSGSNQLHGSAYEFFANDALNANPWQDGASNPKPEERQNQFGGSIGGPIVKDKVFYFADYEGLRQIMGSNPITSQVPTLAQYDTIHSGNTAAITALADGGAIDPAGLDYAMLYPAPNAPSTPGAVTGAYVTSPKTSRDSDTADGRVDWQISQKDLIYGRYTYNRVPSNFPGQLPLTTEDGLTIAPGGSIFDYYGSAKDDAQNAQINYVRTISPTILLQLGFGYTRINNQSFPLNYGENINQAFGQPNINLNTNTSGLTPASVSQYADLGDGAFIPIMDVDNTFQEQGSVTINRGAHSIKVGAALIHRQALNFQNNYGNGDFSFNPINGDPTGLAALLQGDFNSVQRSNSLIPPHYFSYEPSVYVQDDWHAASNLTLNIGVRYEVFTPFTEKQNALANFDPTTETILVAGQNGVNDYAGLHTTWSNLAPRLGFAYTAAPGLVIRGGFGITNFPSNYTSNGSEKAQPFVSDFDCNNGACPNGETRFIQGLPIPTAASATNPTGSINDVLNPAFRTSYIEQFNLTVEKAFGPNVLQVTGVGELGRHLAQISNDENAPALVSNLTLDALAIKNGETPAAAFNTLRPFYAKLPGVTSVGQYQSTGASSYSALQVSLTRRTTAGLTVGANYTQAHNLDNILGFSNEVNDGYGAIPSELSTVEYGNSDLDIRQRGVVTGDYQLPFGRNLKGIEGALGKGWQANTLLVWETGLPFTVLESLGVSSTTNAATTGRPNQIGNGKVSNPNATEFFNTADFVPQASGTLGTEERNPLYGPHFRHVDFSVFKNFNVYRDSTLEFRAECFNITNTTNLANPNATINVTPNSIVASYPGDGAPAGQNVTLPGNTYTVSPGTAGTITGTSANYTPREIQFALKYQF